MEEIQLVDARMIEIQIERLEGIIRESTEDMADVRGYWGAPPPGRSCLLCKRGADGSEIDELRRQLHDAVIAWEVGDQIALEVIYATPSCIDF